VILSSETNASKQFNPQDVFVKVDEEHSFLTCGHEHLKGILDGSSQLCKVKQFFSLCD